MTTKLACPLQQAAAARFPRSPLGPSPDHGSSPIGSADHHHERTASPTRAIAAFCRDCIVDTAAPGTAAQQIAACPQVRCPLWQHRPLPRQALPGWLTARDPRVLPQGFLDLTQPEVIELLRQRLVLS